MPRVGLSCSEKMPRVWKLSSFFRISVMRSWETESTIFWTVGLTDFICALRAREPER